MNLPHIERMEFATECWANSVGGEQTHQAMYLRKVPLNSERAALKAAVACGVKNLDEIMQRNARGNLTKNRQHAGIRAAMYAHMRAHGFSYPEIAAAFGVGHPGVVEAVHHRLNLQTPLQH